jgi:hypothetical protein
MPRTTTAAFASGPELWKHCGSDIGIFGDFLYILDKIGGSETSEREARAGSAAIQHEWSTSRKSPTTA